MKTKHVENEIYRWLRINLDKIAKYEETPTMMKIGRGTIGVNSGSSWGQELHPDFLAYLDTPEYIRKLSKAMKELKNTDEKLYVYITLRGYGLSNRKIELVSQEYGIPIHLLKIRVGRNNTPSKEYYKLRLLAFEFFLSCLPQDKLEEWNIKIITQDLIEKKDDYWAKRKRNHIELAKQGLVDWSRRPRVVCPVCGGDNNSCYLCAYEDPRCLHPREWDGTVTKWVYKKYMDGGFREKVEA